jgi:predicted phosphodiesterase
VKLVHAADLHIDSPMRGLERYEGAPVEQMRSATRRALEAVVDLCLTEDVDALLLAGDVFDGGWKDYATGLFFARQMSSLRQAGVRVVSVRGNHDAASEVQKHLVLPENVRELSTRQAETVVYEDIGLAVHGQGFSRRAVTDDLAAGYPAPVAGALNVGLLHTSLTGRPGHEPYAPCRLETLVDRGYDYWALGHVHAREILHTQPTIAFAGNLQGRHVRETGAKGVMVIEATNGRVQEVTFRAMDTVRWCDVEVDASDAVTGYDVVELSRVALGHAVVAAEGRPVAARVTVMGGCAAHENLANDYDRWVAALQATATDTGELWIEKVRLRTTAEVDVAALVRGDDALAQVARGLVVLKDDAAERTVLLNEVAEVLRKLPNEVRGLVACAEPEASAELIDDVASLLMARLGSIQELE